MLSSKHADAIETAYTDLVAFQLGLWQGGEGLGAIADSLAHVLRDNGHAVPSENDIRVSFGE